MAQLTFDQLPNAVSNLQSRIDSIENKLDKLLDQNSGDSDELLTVPQCAELLSISVQTVYGLISRRQLPVMKRSSRCYFSKRQILNYLKAGQRNTEAEIDSHVDTFLTNNKKSRT